MRLTGQWRNEYGSVLDIANEEGGRLSGTFRTALGNSGFAGEEVAIQGLVQGACVHFAFAHAGGVGDTIASFTGLVRDGALKTMWHVISDRAVKPPRPGAAPEPIELPWAHAVQTSCDTFTRFP